MTADELLDHARSRLAGFKTPRYIELVETVPENPSGKILERELRATFDELAAADDR